MTASQPEPSRWKRLGIPTALVVGGVTAGSFLAPIGLASADQTESPDTESPDTDGSESERDGRRGRRGAVLDTVAEALGLTSDEVKQGLRDGNSLADLAAEQGVDAADVRAALVAEANERIDQAVQNGRLDEADADEKRAMVEERVDDLIERDPSEFEGRKGRGHHRGHGHGRGHRHGLAGSGIGSEVPELLGLSAEEIRNGFRDGKSLADLAAEQGVSVDEVTAALTTGLEERLDGALEEGKIDEERADEIRERFEASVEDLVNGEFEHSHSHGHGPGRRGFHQGDRGADGADVEDTSLSA